MFVDHADVFSLHSLIVASLSLRWSIMSLYSHKNWGIPLVLDIKMYNKVTGSMRSMPDLVFFLNFT
jgi:hypothetical protein